MAGLQPDLTPLLRKNLTGYLWNQTCNLAYRNIHSNYSATVFAHQFNIQFIHMLRCIRCCGLLAGKKTRHRKVLDLRDKICFGECRARITEKGERKTQMGHDSGTHAFSVTIISVLLITPKSILIIGRGESIQCFSYRSLNDP